MTGLLISMVILLSPSPLPVVYSDPFEVVTTYYHDRFEGRLTANNEVFRQAKLTAAHLELPFGTLLELTNPTNGKKIVVRINDRGPYVEDHDLDITKTGDRLLEAKGKATLIARTIRFE